MAVLNLILTLFFCCCSLDQHREYYTKVKRNKYSDILIPHAHFTSKNSISFPVDFASQLPSVSPALQQESNVSSFVFSVQYCQILSQRLVKCLMTHGQHKCPTFPWLSLSWCRAVLSFEGNSFFCTSVTKAFCHPSTDHAVQGFQWSSVLQISVFFLHQKWVEDDTCIPFWLFHSDYGSPFLVSVYCFLCMSTSESFLTLLNIPWNTFPLLVLLLEGAGFLPWGSLYIPFCLYQTSHPWIGYQKFVPQFHSFLLCVHCQLANVLLRSRIHYCLDLCQLLDKIVVFYLCWSLWKPLQMLQDRL